MNTTEAQGERAIALANAKTLKAQYKALGFANMLTPDGYNPKTKKGRAKGYSTAILHLAPADLSGIDVCHWRSAGCTSGCLNLAGRGGIFKKGETTNNIQLARINRTLAMRHFRHIFNDVLVREIEAHVRRARKHGLIPCVRLNGTSDVPFELRKLRDGRTILETFPDVQFYDYTKSPERAIKHARGEMPANYHLTFSRSEVNDADVAAVLAAGGSVAVVFEKALPDIYAGRRVVNADADDLRFLDPAGVILGLKAKGRARKDTSGFVVRLARAA